MRSRPISPRYPRDPTPTVTNPCVLFVQPATMAIFNELALVLRW